MRCSENEKKKNRQAARSHEYPGVTRKDSDHGAVNTPMWYKALLCLAGSNTVLSRSLIGLSVCDSHALGSALSVVVLFVRTVSG